MDQNLPDEKEYPNLADILRSGGQVVIGENHRLGSFAHLMIDRQTYTVASMHYQDLAEVLRQLEWHAKEFIEKNW